MTPLQFVADWLLVIPFVALSMAAGLAVGWVLVCVGDWLTESNGPLLKRLLGARSER